MKPALSHFTNHPLTAVKSVEQSVSDLSLLKPEGLWISVDGEHDWVAYLAGLKRKVGARHYRITIAEHAGRVLWIERADKLVEFHERYAKPFPSSFSFDFDLCAGIDWVAVAREYAGVIIAPYQWSCRRDLPWYWGWDCASGCIWDASAIERVEEIAMINTEPRAPP